MKGGRLASPPFFQLNSSWNTWRAWAVASYWVWRHQRGQCPPRHDSSHWQKGTANQRQNSRIEVIFHPLFQSFIIKLCIYHLHCYNRIQVQLLCLLTPSLLLLAFVQLGFAKNVRLTSLSCYMDVSKMCGFLWFVIWICHNWYIDFSKLLHALVKIYTWISLNCYPSCSKYCLPFVKQYQAEVWPRFQSLLKLLPWTKGVE